MGNRAVITTKENFENDGIGIYLHWNGGRDSVEAFLDYCKMRGFRSPDEDNYGRARLAQVIGNFFGGGLSVGIDRCSNLDCNNYDNGVYFIKEWKIVGREYFRGSEQNEYDRIEMLVSIDEAQPLKEQLGEAFFHDSVKPREELKTGDMIRVYDKIVGNWTVERVVGFGKDKYVNGCMVKGVPFVAKYGLSSIEGVEANINNYLFDKEYHVIGA